MNDLKFQGKITQIIGVRNGTTEKGDWASVEFEVTESNPVNIDYPQIGKFDMFKNGEYIKYAKDFEQYYPIGTEVVVEFNLKKNEYKNSKDEIVGFYKTSAWKLNKLESSVTPPVPTKEAFQPIDNLTEVKDDLPF